LTHTGRNALRRVIRQSKSRELTRITLQADAHIRAIVRMAADDTIDTDGVPRLDWSDRGIADLPWA